MPKRKDIRALGKVIRVFLSTVRKIMHKWNHSRRVSLHSRGHPSKFHLRVRPCFAEKFNPLVPTDAPERANRMKKDVSLTESHLQLESKVWNYIPVYHAMLFLNIVIPFGANGK